jgi:uncharacterized Zn finger protein (UPF0148 family)
MPAGVTCPECGGTTRFNPSLKRIVCESCGLSFTREEIDDIRRSVRKEINLADTERQAERKVDKKKRREDDYLKWWTSEHSEES